MNVFGMGGTELLIIVLIMLIIAGPKRMLQWAYIAGKWLTQLRVIWGNMMETVQKEMDEAGVNVKLPKDLPTRSDLTRMAGEIMRPVNEPVKQVMDEVDAERKKLEATYQSEAQKIDQNVRGGFSQGFANGNNGRATTSPKPDPNAAPKSSRQERPVGFGTWSGTMTNPTEHTTAAGDDSPPGRAGKTTQDEETDISDA